jgi:hypothetical protein
VMIRVMMNHVAHMPLCMYDSTAVNFFSEPGTHPLPFP